jgi:hypothetical protein
MLQEELGQGARCLRQETKARKTGDAGGERRLQNRSGGESGQLVMQRKGKFCAVLSFSRPQPEDARR